MKLAWATDIHLDHARESVRRDFCQARDEQTDALNKTCAEHLPADSPLRPQLRLAAAAWFRLLWALEL